MFPFIQEEETQLGKLYLQVRDIMIEINKTEGRRVHHLVNIAEEWYFIVCNKGYIITLLMFFIQKQI